MYKNKKKSLRQILQIKTGNSHAATNIFKFLHHVVFLILKHLIGNSQICNIVHYSPAFLSLTDLADTKEISRNTPRNSAALILFMCTKPVRSQINSNEFLR